MYDVIIVGGGIAGCYLASRLGGLNVLLIEKDKKVTLKDSGIVSRDFLEFFSKKFVKTGITRMNLFSPSGKSFTLYGKEPFAYILRREAFGRYLRSIARKADIVYEAVTGVEYFEDFVRVTTTGGSYEGKVVVGADGAGSAVRKAAGIESPQLSLGMMVHTAAKLHGNIDVFFDKRYSPDFFTWIIPQNNEYGIMSMSRPRERLKFFAREHYLPHGRITAHMIPTGYVKSYVHRTLLVGDSAGQNKPLTGGGIMFGLRAAAYASSVLRAGNYSIGGLSRYEKLWKRDFGWEIDKQFLARTFYKKFTNKQLDRIFTELGPEIEKLSGFDYDKFSGSWIRLPKIKLLKIAVSTLAGILL
ncbi:MAG TPA: NAD(P)/FAD-dependent oxidoreductase [archaeon]|nr:NAD(P)/FAD-dependent oxidoreductase [archaeon]